MKNNETKETLNLRLSLQLTHIRRWANMVKLNDYISRGEYTQARELLQNLKFDAHNADETLRQLQQLKRESTQYGNHQLV